MKRSLLRWSGVAALALFIGTGSLSAQTAFSIGDSVGVNTNTTYPTPFGDWYKTQRVQYLYPASELSAMGMGAGDITELAWYCNAPVIATDIPGLTEGYTIKMMMTATTDLGAAWEEGATIVWGPMDFTPTTSAMNNFVLDVPFTWDGTSNIVIEICGGSSAGTYTDNGVVAYATTAYNSSRTFRSDTELSPCTYSAAATTGTNPTRRPVTIFYGAVGDECTGTPDVSAAVSSAESVCAADVFTLSVDGIAGFGISYQWQSSADGISYSDIAGATASSYDATQSEATYYQCVVTCAGSGESGTSASVWVGQNAATDCYCIPDYTSILSGDYVDDFSVADISNFDTGESGDNYNDFTYLSTDLTIGAEYEVFVDCGPSWDQGIAVYIDMNVDGTFSADERLGCTLVDAGTGGATYTIMVPLGTAPGTTRMRVLADYADDCTSSMDQMAACEISSSFGETEDYTVNLVDGEACNSVTGLSADAGSTSATLSWDDMGATKYRFAYGQVGVPASFTNGQTFGTSVTFTGLVPGGSYTARVARDCYPDGWSAAEEISWTMSLREGQVAQEVLVYPNPSNGNFRIQLNGYATDNLVIVITNAIGQVVYNNSMSVNESITVKEISLNDLAAGTYTLKLIDGNNVTTRSIVIE